MAAAEQGHVLVCGGAGFIGSHMVDRLLQTRWQVTVLDSFLTGRRANLAHLEDNPLLEVIEHDVIDPLPVGLRADRIINLACAASPVHYQADPEHTMLTSVIGTCRLLRLAERCGARFLLASTSEVYGNPEVHPQPESYRGSVNPTGPRACYDEGKRAAEALAFDFRRGRRADVRVARIFNTYGPRMRRDDGRVVSNLIMQALEGRDITIYGDGRQTRSFCYVDDMVDALLRLAGRAEAPDAPVNLGNPEEVTVLELARLIAGMTGSKSRVVHRPLPQDDPQRRRPMIDAAISLLGWRPSTPLRIGLDRTIAYFGSQVADATEGAVSPPLVA